MDRDQIIKSLECCTNSETCFECPYNVGVMCVQNLLLDALALARELMDENERLKKTRYMAYPDGRLEPIPSIASVKADIAREIFDEICNTCMSPYGDIDNDAYCKLVDKYTREADR